MRFICGCNQSGNVQDMPTDHDGFVVCPAHGERRYGWRALPTDTQTGFPDYVFQGYSYLEIERFMLYGEKAGDHEMPLISTVEDIRDNRDPQEIGQELLAKKNGYEQITLDF